MAWIDAAIIKATEIEEERINHLKEFWTFLEGFTSMTTEALGIYNLPAGVGLVVSTIIGGLNPDFEADFANYKLVLETFTTSFKALASGIVSEILLDHTFGTLSSGTNPGNGIGLTMRPDIVQYAKEHEAFLLSGWMKEHAFLGIPV